MDDDSPEPIFMQTLKHIYIYIYLSQPDFKNGARMNIKTGVYACIMDVFMIKNLEVSDVLPTSGELGSYTPASTASDQKKLSGSSTSSKN